jgi:2,4-dienoyl-CoA reductase-like NADH-dependent reductase (Old Yellow Enzyme family)/thioredoxin reductase
LQGSFDRLFSSVELRGRTLRNRIVNTAHTTSLGEDGLAGDRCRAYYRARAEGGAGMIVMEPTPVHPTARITADNFLTDDDRVIEPLSRLAADVRGAGAVLVTQLYHVGLYGVPVASMRERWGPSAIQPPGAHDRAHAMTKAEIAEVVAGFGRAAARSARAGCDGVEVLMAHDGLLDSFMSPLYNQRTDEYGGTCANRLRFAHEVLEAIREVIGEEYILGVTLSGDHFVSGGLGIEDCAEIAVSLAAGGALDYLAIGNSGYQALHLNIPTMDVARGFGGRFAAAVRAAEPDALVIAEGRISTPEIGERLLADGACDLVGMTRALIADPELPNKAKAGRLSEIRPCIACNQLCWGRRNQQFFISCLQNPAAGLELHYDGRAGHERAAARRRDLLVIGGGPAGLEAARVAAQLGHRVRLIERSDRLGGQALIAAKMPHHGEFAGVVSYRERELERLGVEIRLGFEPGAEAILELAEDAIAVATGSSVDTSGYQPALGSGVELAPSASGSVVSAESVIEGRAGLGAECAVVLDGLGHRKALAAAESLASRSCEVVVVTADQAIGAELAPMAALPGFTQRLAAFGVRIETGTLVLSFDGSAVRLRRRYDGSELELAADLLVTATPNFAEASLAPALANRGLEVSVIGDALAPRTMDSAIRDGFRVAHAL